MVLYSRHNKCTQKGSPQASFFDAIRSRQRIGRSGSVKKFDKRIHLFDNKIIMTILIAVFLAAEGNIL